MKKMLVLLPSILFYSLIGCLVACITGYISGWIAFKVNYTLGMILSGVVGFVLAVLLVFWAFRISSPEKAWMVLVPLLMSVLVFTIANTALFFFIFKYQLGQVIENAQAADIENASAEQLFFKLSEDTDFDTHQTRTYYGRNKSLMFVCPLIDKNRPSHRARVWFVRSYSILSSEEESKADFMALAKKLKTDFAFFSPDFLAGNNFNPSIPKELGEKPVFLVGTEPPKVKLRAMQTYLAWSLAWQNILFVVLSVIASPLVFLFVKNLNTP